jgi:putative CRISPR-associated protein (TIGR02619 family)
MKHHILTTGISILTNFINSQEPRPKMEEAIRQNRRLLKYLSDNPTSASAEINSLQKRTCFLESGGQDLSVTLIHTTSEEGRLVLALLKSFLKGKVSQVHTVPIKSFDAPRKEMGSAAAQAVALMALKEMRARVTEHILKMQKQKAEIELNCTGGYKAEIAVLYQLGQTFEVPVYYLHESFKVCVTLP